MFDEYWDLLPLYAPYRQRYRGINAETLHEDMGTFLGSLDKPQFSAGGSVSLMGRGKNVTACLGCR